MRLSYYVGHCLLLALFCISGASCLPKADFPINVEIWNDKNVTVYRSNDTHVVYSPQPLVKKALCIPAVLKYVTYAGSAWTMFQTYSRQNAIWCLEGLKYQAGRSCNELHYTAKSGMCNCVYFFGRKLDSSSQTGTNKIFTVAEAQVNSNFFTGVTAIEFSISNIDRAMGIHVDCRNSWGGIDNIVSRWKQGIASGAQSATTTDWGYAQLPDRDEH